MLIERIACYFSKIWPSITDVEVLTDNMKYFMYSNEVKNRHELDIITGQINV